VISGYFLLCVLIVVVITEHSIYTEAATFENWPEMDSTNVYSRQNCTIINSTNYTFIATFDSYKTRVVLEDTNIYRLLN
jgi:hypothetical protein